MSLNETLTEQKSVLLAALEQGLLERETAARVLLLAAAVAVVKLMDFGIAKLLDPAGAEAKEATITAARLMTHKEKYGDQSEQQLMQVGQRQMTGAKDRATYVALKEAGFDVSRQEGAAIIDYIVCLKASASGRTCETYAPAGKVLQALDTITSLNGHTVEVLSDVTKALAGVQPGDIVKVEFTRDGKAMSGSIDTIQAPGEKQARTIVGFMPIDTTTVKLPKGLKVEIGTEGIGGPSAGTAFTLTLIDALTKGIVAKLLHGVSVRLKDDAGTPQGERNSAAVRDLFDLG